MIRGRPLQGGSRGSIYYKKQMLSSSQANEDVKKKLSPTPKKETAVPNRRMSIKS